MRRRVAPKFFPLAAAALSCAIAAAWLYDAWADPSGYLSQAVAPLSSAVDDGGYASVDVETPSLAFPRATEALGAVIQRNLFSAARRPPSRAIAETPASGSSVADSVAEEPPRLTGVVITPDTRRALVQDEGTGAARVLKPGDTIGAWTLHAIVGDRVAWTSSLGTVTRRLLPTASNPASSVEPSQGKPPNGRRPDAFTAERAGAGREGEADAQAIRKGWID